MAKQYTQLSTKLNWVKVSIILIVTNFFCFSGFASDSWKLTDGKVTIPYNTYGAQNADGESVQWQAGNSNILIDATGNNSWSPEEGEFFTITIGGTANFSGYLSMFLVDEREEAGYWCNLAPTYSEDDYITAGEAFSIERVIQITKATTTNNDEEITLVPSLIFTIDGGYEYGYKVAPKNADGEDFESSENCEITTTNFEVTYCPKPNIENALILPFVEKDGMCYYKATGSQSTNRVTKGQYLNIHFSAIAESNFDKLTYGYTFIREILAENVNKGDTISIEYSIEITSNYSSATTFEYFYATSGEKSTYVALSNVDFSSSITDKPLYAGPAAEMPTSFELSYNAYSSDRDEDNIVDDWQLFTQGVLADYVCAKSGKRIFPQLYDEFHLTMTATMDCSGKLSIYLVDGSVEAGYWGSISKQFAEIDVTEGVEFTIDQTFIATQIEKNGYILQPELEFGFQPTVTSSMEGFDDTKKYTIIPTQFNIDYDCKEKYALKYSTYGGDVDDDALSDYWQGIFEDIFSEATGIKNWEPAIGEKFTVTLRGKTNFSGNVTMHMIDNAAEAIWWKKLSTDTLSFDVVEGEEFSQTIEFTIDQTEFNDYTLVPKLAFGAIPTLTSTMEDFDDTKELALFLDDFSVTYTPAEPDPEINPEKFCKVVVTCMDVTNLYSTSADVKEAQLTGAYHIQVDGLDNQYIKIYDTCMVYTLLKGSQVTFTTSLLPSEELYSWGDGSNDTIKTIVIPDEDSLLFTANIRLKEEITAWGDFSIDESTWKSVHLRALDTLAIYLPNILQTSYGSPLTYTIEEEDSLVVSTISNDTIYFVAPIEAIGKDFSMSLKASLTSETSHTMFFYTQNWEGYRDSIERDSLFPTPQMGLVTVSQETGKNLVVWQKLETNKIDHYNIYRESEVAGEYQKIAEVPYSETSIYEDTEASPIVRAWRYKISASPVDTRYNDSELSDAHKTIHLTKNLGMNNTINLIWDNYEGMAFSTFIVIRNSKVGDEIVTDTLAEIPSNVNSYTDLNPLEGTLSYYVAIKLNEPIDVNEYALKAESGPFSLAFSNLAEIENDETTAINDMDDAVLVYAANKTIYVTNANSSVMVYNVAGSLVAQSLEISNLHEFAVEQTGVYFVKIANKMYKVIVR